MKTRIKTDWSFSGHLNRCVRCSWVVRCTEIPSPRTLRSELRCLQSGKWLPPVGLAIVSSCSAPWPKKATAQLLLRKECKFQHLVDRCYVLYELHVLTVLLSLLFFLEFCLSELKCGWICANLHTKNRYDPQPSPSRRCLQRWPPWQDSWTQLLHARKKTLQAVAKPMAKWL